MIIAEVSIIPIGTGTPSVSRYVAGAIEALAKQKKVKYQMTAMGTILEGELKDVLDAVTRMHESVFDRGAERVVTKLTIDDRRDKNLTIDYKVQSVMNKLG
ncbi:MAG: MTH1187 family thiamine-binding protein [Chloroflexi bacterium]|nr:MTH1187 family thiamine-binding protein [Chloroflexota bacterium]